LDIYYFKSLSDNVIFTLSLHDALPISMASSRVNDIIKIHTNEPIQNIIQAITPTPLSSDSYMLDDRLRADVNEITGVNEYLRGRSEEHTSELQSRENLVCRLLLEKKNR